MPLNNFIKKNCCKKTNKKMVLFRRRKLRWYILLFPVLSSHPNYLKTFTVDKKPLKGLHMMRNLETNQTKKDISALKQNKKVKVSLLVES